MIRMPNYRKMTKAEMERVDPLSIHRHPRSVLADLMKQIGGVGAHAFLHGAGYNTERDALFGCMFAFAMRTHRGREFYMQQVDDPPDFELIALTDRETKEKPFDHINVEVVMIPEELDTIDDKLNYTIDLLRRTKLTNYAPHEGTALLIVVNAACGTSFVESELRPWVQAYAYEFSAFGEILAMCFLSFGPEDAIRYRVATLSNGNWQDDFSLITEFNRPLIEHPAMEKYGVNVE